MAVPPGAVGWSAVCDGSFLDHTHFLVSDQSFHHALSGYIIHADSEDSDKIELMRRMVWVFSLRTTTFRFSHAKAHVYRHLFTVI